MSTILDTAKPPLPGESTDDGRSRYLIGPLADFLLLGGGSIIILALVPFIWPKEADIAVVATTMLLLANLINHPHFANSYQLFYRDFRRRAFGDKFPTALRRKYFFAALVVPIFLAVFLSYGVITRNPDLLGWSTNLMFFLVGWHYVKQGYGMLMVDSVLKEKFLNASEKKILLWNAYTVWITSWLALNRNFTKIDYWELNYYTFSIPNEVFFPSVALTVLTTIFVGSVLIRKIQRERSAAPISGIVAYVVSLYIWLFATHPAMLLIIPAFHSLQYLAVVWRYRLNVEKSNTGSRPIWKSFSLFLFVGFILGYIGFWLAPEWLNENVSYDRSIFGGSLFLFLFWTFINVHHYFLDNVMWRKENPDTRQFLFLK